MNLVDISLFYDEVATRVSGAPVDTIEQEIKATLREFYTRSGSFVTESRPKDIIAGKQEYDFGTQAQGNALTVFYCQVNGHSVLFRGTLEPGKVILHNTYSEDKPKALVATLSIRPRSYNTIPEETITYDFDTIIDGVTGRMFMMPDRPWSNAVIAPYYLKRFRQGQGVARERIRKRYTRNNIVARFPPW